MLVSTTCCSHHHYQPTPKVSYWIACLWKFIFMALATHCLYIYMRLSTFIVYSVKDNSRQTLINLRALALGALRNLQFNFLARSTSSAHFRIVNDTSSHSVHDWHRAISVYMAHRESNSTFTVYSCFSCFINTRCCLRNLPKLTLLIVKFGRKESMSVYLWVSRKVENHSHFLTRRLEHMEHHEHTFALGTNESECYFVHYFYYDLSWSILRHTQ